ncbi:hypothetical protein WN943_015321 [Citrus x changshan-huyou]
MFPIFVLERIVVKAPFLKVIAKLAENLPSAEIQLERKEVELSGDSLSSLIVKELKQLENRFERGITRISSKKIVEMEGFQQANMVTGQELNAIHALASRIFFSPVIIEGGSTAYSHTDKKILHLV